METKQNKKQPNNFTATFPQKLNLPKAIIFIKETTYLMLYYEMNNISAWLLDIAKLMSDGLYFLTVL